MDYRGLPLEKGQMKDPPFGLDADLTLYETAACGLGDPRSLSVKTTYRELIGKSGS
jgi:hypothetical protein